MAATLGHHGHTTDGRSFTHLLKLCRRACRTWARRLGPLDQREYDTRVLVQALDLLEEARPLNANEAALRRLAAQAIQDINRERLTFWRHRFNIRIATEWDENSRFFHSTASSRRRKNLIHCLEHDGQTFLAHDANSLILHNFYNELLSTTHPVEWRFRLSELYPTSGSSATPSPRLSRPSSRIAPIPQVLSVLSSPRESLGTLSPG